MALLHTIFFTADQIILRNGEGFRDFVLRLGFDSDLAHMDANALKALLDQPKYVEPEIDNISGEIADEYKYVAVRRTALFIEESLFRGTQWVVFEPNDEPLWAQIRLNVGAFMHDLFRQGAFQGSTPKEAYFVKCNKETTTQNDINKGIVNILVGFAPLKPAEFVFIKIQQIAGQIES